MSIVELQEALQYSTAGERRQRTFAGVTLTLFSVFIVPLIVSLGYYTASLRVSIAEEPMPPKLNKERIRPLFALGCKTGVIVCAYFSLAVVGSTFLTAGIGTVTTGAFIADNIAIHMSTFFVILFTAIIAVGYILPIAIGKYVVSESLLAAFSIYDIICVSLSIRYFTVMIVSLLSIIVVAIIIALAAIVPPVAAVVGLCSKVPTLLFISRVQGRTVNTRLEGGDS
jgi:hypothetical protein